MASLSQRRERESWNASFWAGNWYSLARENYQQRRKTKRTTSKHSVCVWEKWSHAMALACELSVSAFLIWNTLFFLTLPKLQNSYQTQSFFYFLTLPSSLLNVFKAYNLYHIYIVCQIQRSLSPSPCIILEIFHLYFNFNLILLILKIIINIFRM